MTRNCQRCGSELSPDANYCGGCGALDKWAARERADRDRRADRDLGRRAWAAMIVTAGTLGIIGLVGNMKTDSPWILEQTAFVLEMLLGVIAVLIVGPGSWRHALGRRPSLHQVLLALPVAALTVAISCAYVELAFSWIPPADESVMEPEGLHAFAFGAIVLAPIGEEWLCRGALWTAIRPVTSRWGAIVFTAIVFAFLHGMNGALVLELPHRFAMGLALGWLRARTGSLLPCLVAHAAHNAIVIAIEF